MGYSRKVNSSVHTFFPRVCLSNNFVFYYNRALKGRIISEGSWKLAESGEEYVVLDRRERTVNPSTQRSMQSFFQLVPFSEAFTNKLRFIVYYQITIN